MIYSSLPQEPTIFECDAQTNTVEVRQVVDTIDDMINEIAPWTHDE